MENTFNVKKRIASLNLFTQNTEIKICLLVTIFLLASNSIFGQYLNENAAKEIRENIKVA